MDEKNLQIYNAVCETPADAKRPFEDGPYKDRGLTSIQPIYRIKRLTELFGPVGFGWYPNIAEEQVVDVPGGDRMIYMKIELFVKMEDEWSAPIPGFGSCRVYGDKIDSCYKAAFTDAFGNACKLLGIGADIYWNKDNDTPFHTKAKEEAANPNELDEGPFPFDPPQESGDQQTPVAAPPEKPAQETKKESPKAAAPKKEPPKDPDRKPAPAKKAPQKVPTTVEEARKIVVPVGVSAGQSLGEIFTGEGGISKLRNILKFYTTPSQEYLREGARLLLESVS